LRHVVLAWHLENMASAKRTPKVSRISRGRTLAYARKQKPPADGDGGGDGPEEPASDATATGTDDAAATGSDAGTAVPEASPASPASAASARPAAPIEGSSGPPPASGAPAARPDATLRAEPVEPAHARIDTAPMPVQALLGAPPAMPAAAAAAAIPTPAAAGAVEDPTRMPGPREIPGGHPDDRAAPPGRVPPGDSRSLRRRAERHEFALVYRIQTYVISRVGAVGTRGQWRVVEYPTPTMASHAYAKECSRFVSDGFSDYRE
jgi:hypothetical protein